MINPNNAIGTNAAYEGRTSVNAFNDVLGMVSRGVMSGWACVPDSGMSVTIGGDGSTRDVAIAEDNVGNKTTINNISENPISVTIDSAPGSNSRIDSIVLYVDNPPQGVSTDADNPAACGVVVVKGTVASSPVAPSDNAIRTAITSEGANGTSAYYVVVANITVASGTTVITQNLIKAGISAGVESYISDDVSYIILGDVVIQWGIASNSEQAVFLPITMANTNYSLSLTPTFPEEQNYFWWAHAHTKQQSAFAYRGGYKSVNGTEGAKSKDVFVSWLVVGIKSPSA